jgi:hypothetical protein
MQWNLKMSTFISFDCPIKKISELNSKMTIRYCSMQWEICLNISSLQDHWSKWSQNCQKCNFCELFLKLTVMTSLERNFATKEIISIFPLWTFHFIWSNLPAAPAYGVYISPLSWSDIPELVLHIMIFLIKGCYIVLTRNLLNQGFLVVRLKSSLRNI